MRENYGVEILQEKYKMMSLNLHVEKSIYKTDTDFTSMTKSIFTLLVVFTAFIRNLRAVKKGRTAKF